MNFQKFSSTISEYMGRPWAFMVSLMGVLLWMVSGVFVNFSDTWQLWVNTPTTVLTFLAVFILQASQNEDTRDIQAKLDALINRFDLEADVQINVEKVELNGRDTRSSRCDGSDSGPTE